MISNGRTMKTQTNPNILEATSVSCGYHDRAIVENVSVAVRPGEVFVLLGANGAGKTTLLRALGRLLKPTRGRVILAGTDLWVQSAASVARTLALSPQSEKREWPLTVRQAVLLGRSPHRGWVMPLTPEDRAVADKALQWSDLADLAERPITQLSGGEWRRVVLARTLAQQPRVLMLDEPTAHLDLRFQVEVLRLVRKLAREQQLAVALTLHDLNMASLAADRLALLKAGRLLCTGSVDEILTEANIEDAYGLRVSVARHPQYDKPMIVPLWQ